MRTSTHTLLTAAIFAAFSFAGATRAQAPAVTADIVYAARYYAPVGAKSVATRSHLYRVNPDGTGRRQITFGNADESSPRFTADRKRVVFSQELPGGAGTRLCTLSADGKGTPETLALAAPNSFFAVAVCPSAPLAAVALPYGDSREREAVPRLVNTENNGVVRLIPGATTVAWSTDGRRLYVGREGKPGLILGPDGSELGTVSRTLESAVWVGPDTLVGKEAGKESVLVFGGDGALKREVPLKPMPAAANLLKQRGEELTHLPHLSRLPGAPNAVLVAGIAGDSTSGKWRANWRVDLASGALTWWGETGDMAWAPDGRRFVTSLGRALAPYGKPAAAGGKAKQVWVRPLESAEAVTPEKRKTLVSGLVLTEGFDWKSAAPR